METIPNGMSLFWALFISLCFLGFVAWMAYEIFTAPIIEFDEEESINELNDDKWDAMKHNI